MRYVVSCRNGRVTMRRLPGSGAGHKTLRAAKSEALSYVDMYARSRPEDVRWAKEAIRLAVVDEFETDETGVGYWHSPDF